MVYLVTELAVAPHSRRYANMPEIWDAYRPIIRDLVGSNCHSFECLAKSQQKNRRNSKLKRFESVELVREYAACMDEISQIHDICEQKSDFLRKLSLDCRETETPLAESGRRAPSTGPSKETLIQRVDDAIKILEEPVNQLPRLLKELKSSLDVVSLAGSEFYFVSDAKPH